MTKALNQILKGIASNLEVIPPETDTRLVTEVDPKTGFRHIVRESKFGNPDNTSTLLKSLHNPLDDRIALRGDASRVLRDMDAVSSRLSKAMARSNRLTKAHAERIQKLQKQNFDRQKHLAGVIKRSKELSKTLEAMTRRAKVGPQDNGK